MLGVPHATDLTASTATTSCFLDAGVPLVVPWLGVTSPVHVPTATRTVHVIAESLSTQEPVLMVEPWVALMLYESPMVPAKRATIERFSTLHWTPAGIVIGLLVKPVPPPFGGVFAGAATKKTLTSRA